VVTNCITYVNWQDFPSTFPEVTNDGGVQALEWTRFLDSDPETGSVIVIKLSGGLLDTPVDCEGLGLSACVPMQKDLLKVSPPYTVSDTDAGGDPLFTIIADETEISLAFTDLVTGSDLDSVGFRLTGLDSTEDLSVGTITDICASQEQDYCVSFLDWNEDPSTRPEITNNGGVQTLEWTLFTGGDPETGSVIVIRPVPEPAAAGLAAAALATVGLIRLAARRPRP